MSQQTKEIESALQQEHRKHAVNSFNGTWSLIDMQYRTEEENDRMIHMAHASRFHWGEIGTPLELERAEWLISRVYSILKRPEPALYHAKKCLEICLENGIDDFDLAFAYEAIARAHTVSGNTADAAKFVKLGQDALREVKDINHKAYTSGEIDNVVKMIDNLPN